MFKQQCFLIYHQSFKSILAIAFVYAATGAFAASFEVGENKLWGIPSSPSYYSDWASKQTFAVGDTLVFNFNNGAHDVVEMSKADYDSCSAASPVATYAAAPATVQLTSAGPKFFISGVNGHCDAGQKMALTVAAASTPSAAPPTPAGRSTATRPTSSRRGPSASGPGVAGTAASASLGVKSIAATFGLTIMAAVLIL